ncbi:hypothetical protein ASF14_01350 [Sphingomonas sp. Leaf257]|nr:hypothetical protein ASF14_01350 [Sphingomonas sp. Leaf257]
MKKAFVRHDAQPSIPDALMRRRLGTKRKATIDALDRYRWIDSRETMLRHFRQIDDVDPNFRYADFPLQRPLPLA